MGRIRVDHPPVPGPFLPDVCECGIHISRHRPRLRKRDPERVTSGNRYDAPIFAIDGEGLGRSPHRYVYLACVSEDGRRYDITDHDGLSTRACLDFLLSLGEDTKALFGYGLGYDYSMWLRDLPPAKLYLLTHPELRSVPDPSGFRRIRPITWADYRINYVQRKLSIQRLEWPARLDDGSQPAPKKVGRPIIIWDVFPFFQSRFTSACADWKVLEQEDIDTMQHVKDARAHLESLPWTQVTGYCQSECAALARLVRKLIRAHQAADLQLRGFYGAGSTASALLTRMHVKEHLKDPPKAMMHAVRVAFSGGRFETSFCWPVNFPCYADDIASAYPYHTSFLPCLACSRWENVRGRSLHRDIDNSTLACIRVSVAHLQRAWGPFPFRATDGTITYPLSLGETWVWKDEYLAALSAGFRVEAHEAWILRRECEHLPFRELPLIYKERVRIGKDGPGIVLKLGPNSVYGKLAQSKGAAPFHNLILAGNITSSTRAQLLRLMATSEDWGDILMVATDGILSLRPLVAEPPIDTGTSGLVGPDGPKPALGAWERKVYNKGMFLIRPGIYFPLRPTEKELKEVKSRGIAKKALLDAHATIVESFAKHGPNHTLEIPGERFVGMKGGISRRADLTFRRTDGYCDWCEWPISISYDPKPKRAGFARDGRTLVPWDRKDGSSAPYDKNVRSLEAMQLEKLEKIMSEAPDEG